MENEVKGYIIKKNRRALWLSGALAIALVIGVLFYEAVGGTVYMSMVAILGSVLALITLTVPYLKEKKILK
jgi:hypothetical protein